MDRSIVISLFVAFSCVASLASARGADPQAVIRGTAFYRERIALPPEAVFEAVIADVSRADAPADVLGRVRLELPGQVPIRFEIPYDPARVDETHLYGVRASITVGGQLWFTTDRFYPVLTGNHPARVDLLLVRVEGMEQEDAFLKALEATASWEIRGEHLELYNAEGAMLLRFESRYMG